MSYNEYVKRVLTLVAIVVLVAGLWYLRTIFMLAFLSAIIALSLSIPVNRLQRWGMRRGLAIAITLIGVVWAIVLFMTWILPVLVVQMADLVAEFPTAFEEARAFYTDFYTDQTETLQGFLPRVDDEQIQQILSDVADLVSPLLAGAGNALLGAAANLVVIVVVSIFLLLDPKDYALGFIALIPGEHRERALEVMVELRRTLTTWMNALLLSISVTVFLVWLLLGIVLGVPNALALGVIAGVMTIIPNIGSLVALFPIVIFTLADEPLKLPIVIVTYLIIQQLESNVITPTFVKRELRIPAAAVFIFQLIAAALFGFFGILLAVPLLAGLITLVRELYVYDMLGMRGVQMDFEAAGRDGMRLVVERVGDQPYRMVTQTIRVPADAEDSPPEDWLMPPEGDES